MDDIITLAIKLLVVPVLPITAGFVVNLIRQFIKRIELSNQNETAKMALELLDNTVESVVTGLTQTTVKHLKESNNGKLTDEQKNDIFETAKVSVLEALGEGQKQIMNSMFKDFEKLITYKIESAVLKSKNLLK